MPLKSRTTRQHASLADMGICEQAKYLMASAIWEAHTGDGEGLLDRRQRLALRIAFKTLRDLVRSEDAESYLGYLYRAAMKAIERGAGESEAFLPIMEAIGEEFTRDGNEATLRVTLAMAQRMKGSGARRTAV